MKIKDLFLSTIFDFVAGPIFVDRINIYIYIYFGTVYRKLNVMMFRARAQPETHKLGLLVLEIDQAVIVLLI